MAVSGKATLDQALLKKMALKVGKSIQYVREQTSRRASRLSIGSEAAQVLWARELGLGAAAALRRLPPHLQEQVQTNKWRDTPPRTPRRDENEAPRREEREPFLAATDCLLVDTELRARCRDLLTRPRHFDRAVREATTILENRIKSAAKITGTIQPEDLVNRVLNGDRAKAILLVGTEPNEQQGFHSLCRGIVLAFRHKAHHNLDDGVTREGALKLCAFIDVLLALLGTATRRPGA